jgi:hypothetical protein
MPDTTTVFIILFFLLSSAFGHQFLHRVIRTPAQYYRPEVAQVKPEVQNGREGIEGDGLK